MNDINTLCLVGRLTRDAEITYTSGGMAILNFSLAVNRSRKGPDGNYIDEANYFNCNLFGKMGESLKQYMTKGKQVAARGFLRQETWEKDGQKHSTVKVCVEDIQLLGGNQQNGGNSNYQQQAPQQAPQQTQGFNEEFHEDIPF